MKKTRRGVHRGASHCCGDANARKVMMMTKVNKVGDDDDPLPTRRVMMIITKLQQGGW